MATTDIIKGLGTATGIINQVTALLSAVQPEIAAGRIAASFIAALIRRAHANDLTNDQLNALLVEVDAQATAEREALAAERRQAEADQAAGL